MCTYGLQSERTSGLQTFHSVIYLINYIALLIVCYCTRDASWKLCRLTSALGRRVVFKCSWFLFTWHLQSPLWFVCGKKTSPRGAQWIRLPSLVYFFFFFCAEDFTSIPPRFCSRFLRSVACAAGHCARRFIVYQVSDIFFFFFTRRKKKFINIIFDQLLFSFV